MSTHCSATTGAGAGAGAGSGAQRGIKRGNDSMQILVPLAGDKNLC